MCKFKGSLDVGSDLRCSEQAQQGEHECRHEVGIPWISSQVGGGDAQEGLGLVTTPSKSKCWKASLHKTELTL